MYEPYGEKKKLKLDVNSVKEKIKEKLGDLNFGGMNKMTYVIGALILLFLVSGITGFVTYTGKVEEMEQRYMVMERQIQGLQDELAVAGQELSTCSHNLEITQGTLDVKNQELANTILVLDETQANLGICNQEKSDLSARISSLEDDIMNLNTEFDDLTDDYSDLENNFEDLACNVAKLSSCEYYILEGGSKVVCCFKYQGANICGGDQVDDVMDVNC